MTTSPPLVSILIPAYNPRYFAESLQSALDQSYPNVEIIVCDDSAGDEIGRIATRSHSRPVRYEKNAARLMGRGNANKCFSLARGDFIKFLNDDDRLTPECIERLIAPMLRDPGIVLSTSKRQRIDANGACLPDSEATLTAVIEDARIEGRSACVAVLEAMTNFIGEPSTPLLRRSALPATPGDVYSYAGKAVRYFNDVALWFTALEHGDLVYLARPLSDFRVHAEQFQQQGDVGASTLPNYRLLCRLALARGLLTEASYREFMQRPRIVPGWATLHVRPLDDRSTDWTEQEAYFGPERIARGARSAAISEDELLRLEAFDWRYYSETNEIKSNDDAAVIDHFLRYGQFEYRAAVPRYAHTTMRTTRRCTNLWNQLLVDPAGNARPCSRYDNVLNLYDASTDDGLDEQRFRLLIGRPEGPCADCDLHPLVPLKDFVRHNFDGRNRLVKAHADRAVVSEHAARERPRHVLVVGHSAGRAGGEFVALAVVQGLREKGCQVTTLLARGGELVEEFRRHSSVHVVGEDLAGPEAVRQLAVRLRLQGVHHAICNTTVVGRYATLLEGLGYQVISLVHELGTSIEHFLPAEDRQGVCDHSDALVFPAAFVEQSFLERYAPRTGRLLRKPQGIEPNFPRPADRTMVRRRLRDCLGVPEDARLVIGAGSGELRKGPDLFLQVARKVIADEGEPDVHFVWLGKLDATLASWIEHDCHALRLDDRFHLAGLQADLTDFYLGADLFLMTSREDPLPNVVIESMYAGLPVVTFAGAGGVPELLDDGCGIVVPYLDVDAMANAARHLLGAPSEAGSIAVRAMRRVDAGFRRGDYVDFLFSQLASPAHTVAAVLPGMARTELLHLLETLAASSWKPDVLCFAQREAEPVALPHQLARIPVVCLELPPDTAAEAILRAATAAVDSEVLWFVDADIEAVDGDIPALLSAFDAPQTVAAFGPGHDPARAESLPLVPRALLQINDHHWLKPQWLTETDAAVALARSTPVLALASAFLRRTAIEPCLAPKARASAADGRLWCWSLLASLSQRGILAWTPRPPITLAADRFPCSDGDAERWLRRWSQVQEAVVTSLAAEPQESHREGDRRQLSAMLGLPPLGRVHRDTEQDVERMRPAQAQAQPEFREALTPKQEFAKYQQAARHLDEGRLDKAKAVLTQLAEHGSTLWQTYFDLGRIAFAHDQTDEAIGHFRTAAGLEFSSTSALRNLVVLYSMKGEYLDAMAAAGLALRREDDPELTQHLRAIVTEAPVALDNPDWASAALAQDRREQQDLRVRLEHEILRTKEQIAHLERRLLLEQAGLRERSVNPRGLSEPTADATEGHCVVCDKLVPAWLPYRNGSKAGTFAAGLGMVGSDRRHFWCPSCRSHDRERHLFLYLQHLGVTDTFSGARVLHLAPEANLARLIESRAPIEYIKGDLHPASPDITRLDVEALPYPDCRFDWAICNHVLEHVSDYKQALAELFRVLKPGGRLLCQTPYAERLSSLFEVASLASEEERRLYYGQEDHVRLFGADIEQLIRSAGFEGRLVPHAAALSDKDPDYYGVNAREPLFLFTRPHR